MWFLVVQGIKIAKIDMSTIDTLPQLFLPTDSEYDTLLLV